MSYVSKELSIALSGCGFDVPVVGYYRAKSDYATGLKLEFHNEPYNTNGGGAWSSAPDYITAADWLWNKHRLRINFHPNVTQLLPVDGDKYVEYSSANHRDACILHACTILKERK